MASSFEKVDPPQPSISIRTARQVLVEGNDEVYLFRALVKHVGAEFREIQFHPYGGKTKLRDFLETFTSLSDFDRVHSLAVVADADSNRSSAIDRIRGALRNAGLSDPPKPLEVSAAETPKTCWLVVPHESSGQMLEDVCLQSIKDDPALQCVDEFIDCVISNCSNPPKENERPKARVHAYLSSRERPDLLLGQAAQAQVWNFDAAPFLPFRTLLNLL